MSLFKMFNQPKSVEIPEAIFIKRAETELEILAADLEKKNWSNVHESLNCTELNSSSVTNKMSVEAQEVFKDLVNKTQQAFEVDRAGLDEPLANDIQNALDHIKVGFNKIPEGM